MRGKPVDLCPYESLVGITPACAGKTARDRHSVKKPGDHPRVCGENYYGSSTYDSAEGSPPRVRGKL